MNYPKKQSLLAMLVVRNEADRFLQPVLDRLSILVDGIVILDDASTDHTPALCRAHPRVVRFERLSAPLFFMMKPNSGRDYGIDRRAKPGLDPGHRCR